MAKAAPAFQIYPADYLSSTSTFTDAESGVYSKLLFWSWINGPLPLDSQRVRRAAQSSATDAEWDAIWAVVEPRWVRQENGYVNPRLERTRKEQDDYRERQKHNGALGGRPKTHSKPTTNPVVTPDVTQPVTQTEPTENPSVLRSSPLISDLRSSPTPESEVQTKNEVQREKPRTPKLLDFDSVAQHLKAAAYAHIAEFPDCGDGDLADAVKDAAAKLHVYDYTGRKVTAIVNSVRGYLASVSA